MVCFHITSLIIAITSLETFTCRTVTVKYFTDQNWISKTVHCIRCLMVCKIGLTNWNPKIALLRASMVVTYYIKLFRTRADRHNGILMSLLLLVSETINTQFEILERSERDIKKYLGETKTVKYKSMLVISNND